MPQNDFLPFCPTDTGTNLLSESAYLAASGRVSGNVPGIASSPLNNKALRQSTYVASQVAQYLSNRLGLDVLDNNTPAQLLAQFTATLKPYDANITIINSGSGTFNLTYIFQIVSGSATAAAVYTNNTQTFTVVSTVSGATEIKMTGTGSPSVSGVLTKTSGTGDATLTFYAVRKPFALSIIACGGGGGGGGAATAAASAGAGSGGSAGGTFIALITNNPGSGVSYSVGAAGAAGAAGANAGGNGGATTYGGLTANGGTGGGGGAAASTPTYSSAIPAGGTATGANVQNIKGGGSQSGLVLAAAQASSGAGGDSYWAKGGKANVNGNDNSGAGSDGQGPGAGGSGGCQISNGGAKAGGAAFSGQIQFIEIYQ